MNNVELPGKPGLENLHIHDISIFSLSIPRVDSEIPVIVR